MAGKDLAEISKAWTPDAKKAFKNYLLGEIDKAIEHAKSYLEKRPGAVLGKWTMASTIGLESMHGAYQRAYIAEKKKILDPNEIAGMSVTKYLREVFGHDLPQDPKRASALNEYTNMLWETAEKRAE